MLDVKIHLIELGILNPDKKKTYNCIRLRKYPQFLNLINERTKYLVEAKLDERLYHILHDLFEPIKCHECDCILKIKHPARGYGKFCSHDCHYLFEQKSDVGIKLRIQKANKTKQNTIVNGLTIHQLGQRKGAVKRRETAIQNGNWTDPSLLSDRQRYTAQVSRVTDNQNLSSLEFFDRRGEYHIDHMISVHYGYHNNIPPDVIGHIANLQMIPAKENLSKNRRCSITIEELYERINKLRK